MPQPHNPELLISERPVRTAVVPAASGVAAFVGHTLEGPANEVVAVRSYMDYARSFGGLAASSELSYAVLQFFRNGGDQALIVRVPELDTGLPDLGMIAGTSTSFPMGLGCLEGNEDFDLLCLPDATRPRTPGGNVPEFKIEQMVELWRAGADLCRRHHALLLMEAPAPLTVTADLQTFAGSLPRDSGAFAAAYVPWTIIDDPLHQGQQRQCAPSGTVAGLYARTDKTRGLWKAPAGTEAQLNSVKALTKRFTDTEQGILNPLGINLIRDLPAHGIVAWAARTLSQADEWKYVPVRRLANHIERSLQRGLRWATFEANDEPLWTQLRQDTSDFLRALMQKGAFAGQIDRDCYFVKCDRTTMTQADIDHGLCIIQLGFAPLRPAEFVIVRIVLTTQPPNA